MKVKLNLRGQIFLVFIISLISLSVLLSSPPLILLGSVGISYLIAYPFFVRDYEPPNVTLDVKSRHGILYRTEVDIIKFTITNHSSSVLPMLELKFTLSPTLYLVDSPSTYVFSLTPYETQIFNIPVLPTARGSYKIGPISLSVGDPFFLFQNEVASVDEVIVRVYPKRLGYKVSKAKTKEVFTKLIGLFSTRQKGLGTDFHGLRDYIRGDPSKIVDWAATARRSKLISREYEEEKRLEIVIALVAGTTTRGAKFDFMLGVTMDIFDGFINENLPVSISIFEDGLVQAFNPTSSKRQKLHIWSNVYDMQPKDIYPDYSSIVKWINKEGKTGNLIFIIGDLENNPSQIADAIRNIQMRNNQVIFIDVWGYSFSFETELNDAANDRGVENYGLILSNVIGKGIQQQNVFSGVEMKTEIGAYRSVYGYLTGPDDNIIYSLNRAMNQAFGKKWSLK